MATDDDDAGAPFTSFNFLVSLTLANAGAIASANPLCKGAFSDCDGLDMTIEQKVVREGGNNTRQIHLVGPVSYGNVTLKRGMSRNQDLWKWFNAAAGSPSSLVRSRGMMAGAEIIMRDGAGNPTVRYRLFDCLPVKLKAAGLNAKDGVVAIEEMQIAYSHFTIEAA
jgi:phage tail-like protein